MIANLEGTLGTALQNKDQTQTPPQTMGEWRGVYKQYKSTTTEPPAKATNMQIMTKASMASQHCMLQGFCFVQLFTCDL